MSILLHKRSLPIEDFLATVLDVALRNVYPPLL